MHRKPAFLLSSYQNICYSHAATPHTTSTSTRPSRSPSLQPPRAPGLLSRSRRTRRYASLASDPSSPASAPPAEDHWPSTSTTRNPTPYQILSHSPSAKYSKRRFFELVKLYHPDRNPSEHAHLNPCGCGRKLMLERYRLLVAAHTILSDPDKRSAYDRFGTGWAAAKEGAEEQWSTTHRWRGGKANAGVDDDPMYCATWEDWERWYERQRNPRAASSWSSSYFHGAYPPGQRQGQIFASNYTFLSLVALLAALGGIGQATRAHETAKSRMERAKAVSEESGRQLMRARDDAREQASMGEGKKQRIQRFLKEREGYEHGQFDARSGSGHEDGLCAAEMVKNRDEEPFWRRPPEVR